MPATTIMAESGALQAARLVLAGHADRRLQLLARPGIRGRGGPGDRRPGPARLSSRRRCATARASSTPILLCAAYRASRDGACEGRSLADVVTLAAALRGTSELALESAAQGRALLTVLRQAWPAPALDALGGALPQARGRAGPCRASRASPARRTGCRCEACVVAFLHGFAANLISAGVRLIPLGQTDGQRLTAALEATVQEVAAEALAASLDDLGTRLPDDRSAARSPTRPSTRGCSAHDALAHGPLRVGIGGPVGSGKTALVDALCKRLRDRYDIAVITNDIYTREDAEFLTRSGALPPERIVGVETGGCPHTAIREDASINLAAIEQMVAGVPGARPGVHRIRRRQPRRDLQPGARRPHDLRDRRRRRRQDPAQGRPRHHPLRPAGDQQDRPRAAGRRRPRRDGARRQAHARRAAVRVHQHQESARASRASPTSSSGWAACPHSRPSNSTTADNLSILPRRQDSNLRRPD